MRIQKHIKFASLKKLVYLADRLDAAGMLKEANEIDAIIHKARIPLDGYETHKEPEEHEEPEEMGIFVHDVPDGHKLLSLLEAILRKDAGTGKLIDAMDKLGLYTAGCPDEGNTLETLLMDERIHDGASVVVVHPGQANQRCYWIFSGNSAEAVYERLKGLV